MDHCDKDAIGIIVGLFSVATSSKSDLFSKKVALGFVSLMQGETW